ncbi:hypothetical protein, partial [Erythrobacter sp.]|uniref:hypothetical protein n=1 Tax=Erythrobacter sp. TaxID=1042 RepID=UPI00311E21C8
MSATVKFAGLNRLACSAGVLALCASSIAPTAAMAQQAPRPNNVMVRDLPASQPAKQDPASPVTTDPAAVGGQPAIPAPSPNSQTSMDSR